MTIDVTVRWSGPPDATSGSTYRIERTLDNSSWTTLVNAQAATEPYASVSDFLGKDISYGDTEIALQNDAHFFGTSGYIWLDDALVQWRDVGDTELQRCVWHSGYGTYAKDTPVYKAHETYLDEVGVVSNNVALYRITHINSAGVEAAPTYLWDYHPPKPASNRHCVVVTNIHTDLGMEARSGLGVQAYLGADTEFSDTSGAHLDKGQSANKTATTNVFGVAFHHCWRSSARSPIAGLDAAYTFVLDSASTDKLTVTVATIPDRDWVLLSQIATAAA